MAVPITSVEQRVQVITMSSYGTGQLILTLALLGSVSAYTSRISLCLCTDLTEQRQCGLLDGVLYNGRFIFVDDDNTELSVPIENLKTYPQKLCTGHLNKRFLISFDKGVGLDLGVAKVSVGSDGLKAGVAGNEVGIGPDGVSAKGNIDLGPLGHVKGGVAVGPDGASGNVDAEVHAGIVDANVKGEVDKDGHASGSVGGSVNIEGVQLGGDLGVDKSGHVSGGASVGVGLGSLGGVDLHVTAGPDGIKTGVGAHIDAGPVHAGASVDVDQNGKVSAGASGNADLGPLGHLDGNIGVDEKGHVSGGASGSVGVGPASLSGNVDVGSNGQVSGSLTGGVSAGPINAGGSLNFGSGGQVSGSGSINGNFGSGSGSSSGTGGGGSGTSGSSSGTSSGSGGTDFVGSGGWKPNMMNPGAMMQGLPTGDQSGTGYNPATFFQQAGYQDFLAKMGYSGR